MRLKEKAEQSIVRYSPNMIISATARPAAGACCTPWPEKPVMKCRFGMSGCGPIDAVLVEGVVIIMPGPGALAFDRLKGGNAVGERGPDHLLELVPVRVKIIVPRPPVLILRRRGAGNIARAFGADIDAGRVNDERHVRDMPLSLEIEHGALARLDGKRNAGHRRNISRLRSGGDDDMACGELRSIGERDGREPCCRSVECR